MFQRPISRHSNPMAFSPKNSKMAELKHITESPEYKNNKYSDSKTNTISQKHHREDEVDEYNIYDSPRAESSTKELKRKGLIINVSGSKKSMKLFNKTRENLASTFNKFDWQFQDEIYSDRSHYKPQNIKNGKLIELKTNKINLIST